MDTITLRITDEFCCRVGNYSAAVTQPVDTIKTRLQVITADLLADLSLQGDSECMLAGLACTTSQQGWSASRHAHVTCWASPSSSS